MIWYEQRFFRVPLRGEPNQPVGTVALARDYIEFRITYEHRLCLLGKQQGPLLYTVTLLPGEKVTLYHSERYRRTSSEESRFSVQSTFMQFLSAVHQARVTDSMDSLIDSLSSTKTGSSVSVGGGLAGAFGAPSGTVSAQHSTTDQTTLQTGFVSDEFNQSIVQASQLTHVERSLVVSTFEDKDKLDITARTLENRNECRAVTYFVRKVVELYTFSTRVFDISYRIIAPGVPSDWHTATDIAWLPAAIQNEIKNAVKLLPKVGDVVDKPTPISLPTDGSVYDPELAHCCSCEPQREAALSLKLEKEKAEALKACLEAQLLQAELDRRQALLQKGDLTPFEPASSPAPSA